jgi:serine/threonine-protein kinase RsbW
VRSGVSGLREPLEATLPGGDDALARASKFLDGVDQAYDIPPEVLTNLRIAFDEIVTNIVKYGRSREIRVRCAVRDDSLETTIEDDGVAFDPLQAPAPDIGAALADRAVGGLGIHFVKNLMSSVDYERVGEHNRLTLLQRLDPAG